MRLVQFLIDKGSKLARIGILKNDAVLDCSHKGLPSSLVDLLNHENGYDTLKSVESRSTITHPISSVKLLAPITKPGKILCVGLNYKEHCDELNLPYPPQPVIFSKMSSNIIGPVDDIIKPTCTEALDWEIELVVVIGKKAKQIKLENAFDYVFGYTVGQDLTARDWVTSDKNGGQWVLGKTMDTFLPLGPCIVTKEEIDDPHQLKLKTWVNGILKQDGTSSQMIHRIDKLVTYLSGFITLYPGDLIMTGTPSGVGNVRTPIENLKVGDVLESEIENIGKLSNHVI